MAEWQDAEFASAAEIRRRGVRTAALLVALLLLLAAAILWAAWATIEEVTKAQGTVVPSGLARTVESLEGGIVREILVEEGDVVTAGTVLVRIDDTGAASSLGELAAQRIALQVRAHRLEREAEGAGTLDFAAAGIARDSPEALRAQALFDRRRASYASERAVLEAQASQRRQELSETRASLERVAESLTLLDEEITLRTASGVVPRAQILPLERERVAKRQERDSLRSRIAQAESALREASARLDELELRRGADVTLERAETLTQLSIIEQSLKRAEDLVRRAALRAPVDGIVAGLAVNTVGSVIAPGETILRIVPGNEGLQVEARLRPQDIAFVTPGQAASVKITAFDFTIYGALDGEVIRVGADSDLDPATDERYFPILVETTSDTLSRGGETLVVGPGMVAQVDIKTGQRTVLDYLLKPLRKARSEAMRER